MKEIDIIEPMDVKVILVSTIRFNNEDPKEAFRERKLLLKAHELEFS